ncbi:hypothetical protein GUITHDRAFT_139518 [Guillardia theta CCMP2712]|uniref:Laminin EGF-like domain-containing protein n=1 Tax=Guillardia theta (strain CCMP2712) TaxID=905079 RepID=L1J896_GUITC|nr:hypothetical protein GUITHDRAFT_139518 [Guillardia theta CCMP2712]EKX44567.1 hypothetical protein GUITHDRAFT_139518 [Guillardia theta CCMP2712]|eukprot:XP_005831547.1 hypothetical protein GUITHDRAFT_139518 [Guillardia theta CCMP2712]
MSTSNRNETENDICRQTTFGFDCNIFCDSYTNCSAHGRCATGYTGHNCSIETSEVGRPGGYCSSAADCGGKERGECREGRCECKGGFGGRTCSPCREDQYGASCEAGCTVDGNCSGHGRCATGYTGHNCSIETSEVGRPGGYCSSAADCGGEERGECREGRCECKGGFGGRTCSPCREDQYGASCEAGCTVDGNCSGHGRCATGYTGHNCSIETSEVGRPGGYCSSAADCGGEERGECREGRCECKGGFGGRTCSPCREDQYGASCEAGCTVDGNCSGHGRCATGYTGHNCSIETSEMRYGIHGP